MKKKKSRNWADLVREVGMYVSPSPREGDALARLLGRLLKDFERCANAPAAEGLFSLEWVGKSKGKEEKHTCMHVREKAGLSEDFLTSLHPFCSVSMVVFGSESEHVGCVFQ